MLVVGTLVAARLRSAISVDLCGGRGLLPFRATPQCSHSRVGVRWYMVDFVSSSRDPVISTCPVSVAFCK